MNKIVRVVIALVVLAIALFFVATAAADGPQTVPVRGTPLLEEPTALWHTGELTLVLSDIVADGQNWVLVNHPRWGTRFVLLTDWNSVLNLPAAQGAQNPQQPAQGQIPAANAANCSSPYAIGWGGAVGKILVPTGAEVGFFVYLEKDATGANIGTGVYTTNLPSGRNLHVWNFITEQCALLNQPYINGQ